MKKNTLQGLPANPRLKEAIQNAEIYIEQMKAMYDKKLSMHIDLFRQQQQMALAQVKPDVYELLYEYESLIARVEKMEWFCCKSQRLRTMHNISQPWLIFFTVQANKCRVLYSINEAWDPDKKNRLHIHAATL